MGQPIISPCLVFDMDRHLQKKHFAIIAAVSGIVIVCLFLIFVVLPVGPGLPPPDIRKDWFIPGSDIKSIENSSIYLLGVEESTDFPFISDQNGLCSHTEYRDTATGARLMTESCYFEDFDNFLQAQCELCNYLSSHGSIIPVLLHMKTPDGYEYTLSATAYSTDTFQGYFIVAERPFISSSEDYFILYYGYLDDASLRYSEERVHSLINDASLYATREGSVGKLDCERCD